MKTFFGTVFRFIFLILFLLFAFAGIDYYRMTEGYLPVFSIPSYNSKTRVQTFKGTFYTADRTVRASVSEPIGESSNFHYRLFQFPISIEVPKSKTTDLFDIDGKKSDVCGESQLVYADKERKIYLFCLDDLQIRFGNDQNDINSLIKKDPDVVESIKGEFAYIGYLSDGVTTQYDSREETSSGIRIFQCNGLYIPDVYIGPIDMTLQPDFCTYKDDDFSFIYELVDETPNTLKPMIGPDGKEIPEVFYENEKYRYEFSLPKSNYVFILTPAIRGRDEVRTPIKEALNNHLVTIEEVEQKGLSFTKIDKEEELKKQKVEEDNNNQ